MATTVILQDAVLRHPGFTPSQGKHYCEAASVCLEQWHAPPTAFGVDSDHSHHGITLAWVAPDERARRANANRIDATEAGAYAVGFACLSELAGFLVVERIDQGTGADWVIAPQVEVAAARDTEIGLPDLDLIADLRRLEVSGVGEGDIDGRVRQKVTQVRRGASAMRGVALVVGFAAARVVVRSVEAD